MIRSPANVSTDSSDYLGPILFNPGGPGGSGVEMLAGYLGPVLRETLGPRFDLVSFDPRGMSEMVTERSLIFTELLYTSF